MSAFGRLTRPRGMVARNARAWQPPARTEPRPMKVSPSRRGFADDVQLHESRGRLAGLKSVLQNKRGPLENADTPIRRYLPSKTLLAELAQALFDCVECFVGVDSFGCHGNLRSLSDVGRHDIHDADRGTFLTIGKNGYFALETHRTSHEVADRTCVQAALVRDQDLASLCFPERLLHGSISLVSNGHTVPRFV